MTGNLFIVASPSGGGKTSLVKALIESFDDLEVSISHTTRSQRPGETDTKDYFFIRQEVFEDMIKAGAFLEHALVFGHYYGTSYQQIEARLKDGIDIILDIDWQGAEQIRKLYPNAVSVFIVPPSLDVLKQRLSSRARDDEQTIEQRMKRAKDEISHYIEFDYLIVNDDFETACQQTKEIITNFIKA